MPLFFFGLSDHSGNSPDDQWEDWPTAAAAAEHANEVATEIGRNVEPSRRRGVAVCVSDSSGREIHRAPLDA